MHLLTYCCALHLVGVAIYFSHILILVYSMACTVDKYKKSKDSKSKDSKTKDSRYVHISIKFMYSYTYYLVGKSFTSSLTCSA